MKNVFDSIWEGLKYAFYLWAVFVLINAFIGLIGLSFVLTLPGIFAYFVQPFVMGPVIGIIKLCYSYIVK